MKRLLLSIILIGVWGTTDVSARRRALPADSVSVVARLYASAEELPPASTLYSYTNKCVWINHLVNSFAKFPKRKGPALTLDVIEGSSPAFRYKIRLGQIKSPTTRTICFPIESNLRICVNGRPVECPIKDGVAVLKRKWVSGHEILIQQEVNHYLQ